MNFRWLKTQIRQQLKIFLHQKPKNGFTLYNSFIDIYISNKVKVVLRFIDSIILIVFYSSLVDFYYLGPYLLNLVSSIKYVCQSKEIKGKTINKNFMDINTMVCDLIGFFNGFTRALCQDYNCYLGCDAIYNERCFLHLRRFNNDPILVMCRQNSGSYQYNQLKSMGQIIPRNRNIIQNNDDDNEKNIIKVENKNILNFMKYKKILKKKQFYEIKNNYNCDKNESYNEYNNIKENDMNSKINITMITNNDLPSESIIFGDKEKNNEYDEVLEVFDFINNVTKRNTKEEEYKSKNNDIEDNSYENNRNENINNKKNEIKYNDICFEEDEDKFNSYKPKHSFISRNDNYSELSNGENDFNIHRNKTQKFNKSVTIKNMELIQNIDFKEFNNDENNFEENKKYSAYDKNMRNSLMNNFIQINNNYIDEENEQSFEQINKYNFPKEIYDNENNDNKQFFRNNTMCI